MKRHKDKRLAVGVAGILSCLLLFSCDSDEYTAVNGPEKACEYICFGVSPDETGRTRSIPNNKNGHTPKRFVLRAEGSADTLCVRATVSDGIAAGNRTVTRATPVTTVADFRVMAYWTNHGVKADQFYMNEVVRAIADDVWSSDNTYYWPGVGHGLQFYAYSPVDAPVTAPLNATGTGLGYTVPDEVSGQKDILVAATDMLGGDYNRPVPLTFRHICTVVRFVVGSDMQPGTIKSVALKGVRNSGNYDMAGNQWQLATSVTDFSQVLDTNTTGNETDGTEITTADGTFMMLPQVLPENAEVVVVFRDKLTGKDRELKASVAGHEWPMGKTVTYKLSISPESYELEFVSKPEKQDAHYVIYPIDVKVSEELAGQGWIVESNQSWVTLRKDLSAFEKEGYWIDTKDDKRETTITGNATGTFTIYAFLEESYPAEEERRATLSLRLVSGNTVNDEFEIIQLPAGECGEFLCERIEDSGTYSWGFHWDNMIEEFYATQANWGHAKKWIELLSEKFPNVPDYIHIANKNESQDGKPVVIIYYSKIGTDISSSSTDGLKNTRDLYKFNGENISSIRDFLISNGFEAGEGVENPEIFAAKIAIMKNKFHSTTINQDGATLNVLELKDEDIVWYLPAREQYASMERNGHQLSGTYWTSSASEEATDNVNAYVYRAGSGTELSHRAEKYKIHAARKK